MDAEGTEGREADGIDGSGLAEVGTAGEKSGKLETVNVSTTPAEADSLPPLTVGKRDSHIAERTETVAYP